MRFDAFNAVIFLYLYYIYYEHVYLLHNRVINKVNTYLAEKSLKRVKRRYKCNARNLFSTRVKVCKAGRT